MKKENYRVEFRMNYLPGKEFWKGEGDEEGRAAAVLMSTETTLPGVGVHQFGIVLGVDQQV